MLEGKGKAEGMSESAAEATVSAGSRVVPCATCVGKETALRCGRCDKPICPTCLVQTPVGARCKTCSPMMRAPMYTLGAGHVARAVGAALVGGIVMGLIWGTVGAAFSYGFFLIFLGAGLGWAFTKMMDFATRGKRGPVVVGAAIGGILTAWGMQWWFVPAAVVQIELLAVGVGAYLVYQNLR